MAHYAFWLVLIPSVFFFPINYATPTTLCSPAESPLDACFCNCEDIWQDLDTSCTPLYLSGEERLHNQRLGRDLNRMVSAAYLKGVPADSWVEVTQPGGHTRKIQDIGSCCGRSELPENRNSIPAARSCKESRLNIESYTLSFRNQSRVPAGQSQLASYKITIPGTRVALTASLYRVDWDAVMESVEKALSEPTTITWSDYLVKTKPSQLTIIYPSLRNRSLDEIQKTDFILIRVSLEGKQSNNGNHGSDAKRDDRAGPCHY